MAMVPKITSRTDWIRSPIKQRITSSGNSGILSKIWEVLSQKGDPTLIKCSYCGKTTNEKEAIERELLFVNGCQLSRKKQKYCSNRCAEYDQMAHEL